jgi:hypothetical protein
MDAVIPHLHRRSRGGAPAPQGPRICSSRSTGLDHRSSTRSTYGLMIAAALASAIMTLYLLGALETFLTA